MRAPDSNEIGFDVLASTVLPEAAADPRATVTRLVRENGGKWGQATLSSLSPFSRTYPTRRRVRSWTSRPKPAANTASPSAITTMAHSGRSNHS